MDENDDDIAALLKRAGFLNRHGRIAHQKAADELGCHVATVFRWLNGNTRPSGATLRLLRLMAAVRR